MTCQIRRPGASTWSSIANGSVKYRAADGTWKPARFLRVRVGDVWMDCGYIARPLAPITFRVTDRGNGKDGIVTFSWSPSPDGGAPTSYRFNVYLQNDNASDQDLTFTTSSTTAAVTFPTHPRTEYWVDVTAINDAGDSEKSNRIQITLGPNPRIEYGGGWGPVEWHDIAPVSASSYWNVNNKPVTNISDGNSATFWSSAGHTLPSDSLAYEGVIGNFKTGISYTPNDPSIPPYYRKLAGVRYRGNPTGQTWIGFLSNSVWQGSTSLNSVTGPTATFVQHPYVYRASSTALSSDGWRYVNLTGIYETEQVGVSGTQLSVTWGPALPYSAEGAAWSSATQYRVDVAEIQVGTRSWDPNLNPFQVPAGTNIITYL